VSRRVLPPIFAAAIFLLDRLTKNWIEKTVELNSSYTVIPGFFDIVHTKNRGAAFGMFAGADHPLRTFLLVGVSLAVLLFIAIALLRPGKAGVAASMLTVLGLTLVLGGALGNVYDRIVYGEVTDFLEFYWRDYRFAAFNVADSAITTGAGLLILDMWRTRKTEHVS
jgi:signal peptidase II